MYNVYISSHTDVGDVKKTNQDNILHLHGTINKHNVGLFIVADGCGGLEYGEEISNFIVTHFSSFWNNDLKRLISAKKIDIKYIDLAIDNLLHSINSRAIEFGKMISGKVGSTLSLLLVVDNQYIIKNIGDSRVYLKRGRKILQLTEDQSLVADMVRRGELTDEQAKNFNKKNVLTMCIGFFENLRIYSKIGKIKNKDTFILCCDGLHNHVSTKTIVSVLNNKKIVFEDKAFEMRKQIEPGKANDNVSSVICEFRKKKKLIFPIVILIVVLVLLIGVFKNYIYSYLINSFMIYWY